jgi:hypothetical protein
MNGMYLANCLKCNKKTPHRIKSIRVKRGVKLICLLCDKIQSRYRNVRDLEVYSNETKIECASELVENTNVASTPTQSQISEVNDGRE